MKKYGCFSIRQRYNLKANHNSFLRSAYSSFVVFQYVKDTIWKQITTTLVFHSLLWLLFFNTSKIQFESKSQLKAFNILKRLGCFSIRQRYNLKANHNTSEDGRKYLEVVFQYVKDTIWKQITTKPNNYQLWQRLFFNTSKIQFESKSQRLYTFMKFYRSCFSIRQRYNLKANHNNPVHGNNWQVVVFQYVKDTIWKQITTGLKGLMNARKLFFNTSKIQFESKSQHIPLFYYLSCCCFSIRQRYNLKANHNWIFLTTVKTSVVFQYVKDTIWKQITTMR